MKNHYHLKVNGKIVTIFVADDIFVSSRPFCKCGMPYKAPEPPK
jgi:hypothetical protein